MAALEPQRCIEFNGQRFINPRKVGQGKMNKVYLYEEEATK